MRNKLTSIWPATIFGCALDYTLLKVKPGSRPFAGRALGVQWLVFCVHVLVCTHNGKAQSLPAVRYQQIKSHSLWQVQNKQHQLLPDDDSTVIITLLSPECPMCQYYVPLLNGLQQQYKGRVHVAGIIPGKAYTQSEIEDFLQHYNLQWPVWVDSSLMLTNMLQGRVTPEVFLFNTQGKLVYQGAIDNWMTDLGKKKPKANQHYLQQALEATVKGLPVKQPFQKAAGCRINDY